MSRKFEFLGVLAIIINLIGFCKPANNTCNSKDNSTANYNPFLNFLESNTVLGAVFTSNNFEVCNDIWSEGNIGTCCSKDRINSTFNKMLSQAVTNWDDYISTLVFLRNEIRKEMIPQYTSSYEAQQSFQSMQGDPDYDLNGLSAGHAIFILDSINSFEADMKLFRRDGQACFDFLMKKRGQIFCWGCRYGGESFFKLGGPIAKITPNSAQLLVQTCHSTWKFLAKTQLLRFVWNNLQKYNSETDREFNVTKLDIFHKTKNTDNYGTIFNAFENCPNPTSFDTEGSNCKIEDLQVLSTAFFNYGASEKLMNFAPVTVTPTPSKPPADTSNTSNTSNSTNDTNTSNSTANVSNTTRLLQDNASNSTNTTIPPALPENNPSIVFDAAGIDLTKFPSMATPRINVSTIEFWTAGGIKHAILTTVIISQILIVLGSYVLG